jgi:hypothetical protein
MGSFSWEKVAVQTNSSTIKTRKERFIFFFKNTERQFALQEVVT